MKNLRNWTILPLSAVANCLFLAVAIFDALDIFSNGSRMVYKYITPQESPMLFAAFTVFGVELFFDAIFCILSIVNEKTKASVLAAVLVHHIGFFVYVVRLLLSHSVYIAGTSFCLTLLELCFPLRLIVHCRYPRITKQKVRLQLLVFALDMFASGGGTFVAAVFYIFALADKSITLAMRQDVFWTYLFCFVYWFFQLFTAHRWSLQRLLKKLVEVEKKEDAEKTGGSDKDEAGGQGIDETDYIDACSEADREVIGHVPPV